MHEINFENGQILLLCGFMGSGKSHLLAHLQSLPTPSIPHFYDLDRAIEERMGGQSIAAIFAQQGEGFFRAQEQATLKELLQLAEQRRPASTLIALGGGAFSSENQTLIHAVAPNACTIWLKRTFAQCWRNILRAPQTRPLAKERTTLKQLFDARKRCYSKANYCLIPDDVDQIGSWGDFFNRLRPLK